MLCVCIPALSCHHVSLSFRSWWDRLTSWSVIRRGSGRLRCRPCSSGWRVRKRSCWPPGISLNGGTWRWSSRSILKFYSRTSRANVFFILSHVVYGQFDNRERMDGINCFVVLQHDYLYNPITVIVPDCRSDRSAGSWKVFSLVDKSWLPSMSNNYRKSEKR